MTILVTGATGRVGRHVVDQLVQRSAKVRVLTRDPSKASFPAAVEVAQGDLLDLDALLDDPGTLGLVPVLLAALLAVRGLPALLYRGVVTGREITAAALLQ
ncbi:NAD(P)H-binding protein, partial [Bradyrhizobium sp.]|uniref:NAD(P)H-binding protein n=1 Tax=Bradyrhizobium sp. TaxID=376 RepID=UPI0025BE9A6C